MVAIEQLCFFVLTAAIAIICLRYPTLFVKFILRTRFIDTRHEVNTQVDDVARLMKQDSQAWKTAYPQLASFIKLIGYIAIMFLFVFVLSILLSILKIT